MLSCFSVGNIEFLIRLVGSTDNFSSTNDSKKLNCS